MDRTPDPRPRRRVDYPRADRSGALRWVPSWRLTLAGVGLLCVAAVGALVIAIAVVRVPQPNDIALAQTTTLYWNDGTTVLGRIGAANRTSVPLAQVPQSVQRAVLAAEDRGFYDHTGFSPIAIARAVWHNVSGSETEGGSTITQQYAKNAFLTRDRTFTRKLRELILSVKLELTSSKDQILADYLNTVYYGRGAYGIEAAAQAYFGVPARALSTEQGAVLAALLQSPNALSPENNPQALRTRWAYVLDGMVAQGWLSPSARAQMRFPEIADFQPPTDDTKGSDGYLFAAAQEQLHAMGYSSDSLNVAGLSVVTTFDRHVQAAAVAAVEAAPAAYRSTSGVRIGLAAVDPDSGAVPALYGGPDYQLDHVSAASELRGLGGSSFLPFGLAAGVNQGLALDSEFSGASPVTVDGATVSNAGDESYGKVTLLYATVHSLQTPYVQMNAQIGAAATRDAVVSAGIPADTPGLNDRVTNVTGEAAPTALEQAGAYGTFAARGERRRPSVIQQVRDQSGDVAYELPAAAERAFDPGVADRVTAALRRVVTYGNGSAAAGGTAAGGGGGGQPVAGKTGVSAGLLSEWFAGYAPQLAAAVMVVRQDSAGNAITLSGVGGANDVNGAEVPAAIFGDFMSGALAGQPLEPFAEVPTN